MSNLLNEIKQYIPQSFYDNLSTINVKRSKNTIKIIAGKQIKKKNVEYYKKFMEYSIYGCPREIFYHFEYDLKHKNQKIQGFCLKSYRGSLNLILHGLTKDYNIDGFYWKKEKLL